MDQPDSEHNLKPAETSDTTKGVSSSLELGRVKHVLSVKMEKPDAHYTTIQPLGKGSFGEVHTARDTLLGREVAIKSLKQQFREEEEIVDRFLKEARGTSQLEHPNIMPVHEMGVTDDLGIYFTMKKIEGEDLKEILDRLESNTSFYIKKYPVIRLLEIFLSVCNGIAFAHSKGVIHRDLKPANIMIGEYGEVLILDWGLVKQLDTEEGTRSGVQLRMDEFDVGSQTLDGAISGTPNYMSPEQAEGHVDEVDFQSDIYSLGAILYHMLTYLPPFEKTQLRKLLENVKLGNFQPPRKRRPELRIPRELEAVCLKAMSRFQVNRYRSVERFAEDIRNYLGHREVSAYRAPWYIRAWKTCRRNPIKSSVAAASFLAFLMAFTAQRAMLYGSFRDGLKLAEKHRVAGNQLIVDATDLYDELRALNMANTQKNPAPEEVAKAERLQELTAEIDMRYNLAVGYYDGVPDPFKFRGVVLDGLKEIYRKQIEYALHRERYERARQWVGQIHSQVDAAGAGLSPENAAAIAAFEKQIEGLGGLTITSVSDNVDALELHPIDTDVGARFKVGDPLYRSREFPFVVPKPLKKGSYLIHVKLKNGKPLPYPIYIEHGEQLEVAVEIPEVIPEGMVFVPAGGFKFGGQDSRFYRQFETNLPAFFMKKHEVTVGEYLEFWKTLEDPAKKSACMSRLRYNLADRMYTDAWGQDGEIKDPNVEPAYPVVGITKAAADAFCEWKGKQLGMEVRLPNVHEWEKAARGVDGRVYVWGNGYEEKLKMTHTKRGDVTPEARMIWSAPGKFPADNSVYNAADMAGNVREMTSTPLPDTKEFFQIKGGSGSTPRNFLPAAYSSDTPVVPSDVGFRYIIPIPESP